MDSRKFRIEVREDKRGAVFEGFEVGAPDPERATNLLIRVARDHVTLSVWPIRPQAAEIFQDLTQLLGPPRQAPAVCGFGDCKDDDRDATMETALWEIEPAARPEVLKKMRDFLRLPPA
jgi:hypothetical protein